MDATVGGRLGRRGLTSSAVSVSEDAVLGFDGRVAIITGAGGGLGRAHALLLASRGAMVVVNDLGGTVSGAGGDTTDRGPAARVVDEIESAGGVAVADTSSVATLEGGAAIVQTAIDTFGRVDIVVNNAGILRDKSFHNLTPDLLDPVLDVHLRGAFNVTIPAWRHMRAQGYGRIVNTTSASGLLGNFGQANYAAAKMGLWGLTKVLAIEGASHGILANAIAPIALTRMTEELFSSLAPHLLPERVASVVAYLAHESCGLSGEALSCAGGRVARFFVGLTDGYFDADLAPEGVAANIATILSEADYWVPSDLESQLAELSKRFGVDGR
jgi:NAD(P)-dependent dehydrogenase (short-subunit alcohol dehydrogenase family)